MGAAARIHLCGRLRVELGDRSYEAGLPGRQGRLLVAYLVTNRARPVPRDELVELLWPGPVPADPAETLTALLSKLRASLGGGVLVGRRDLALALPADTWVDVEAAAGEVERAESAPGADEAVEAAVRALAVLGGGFLPGDDSRWVVQRRSELHGLRLRALEALASAALRRHPAAAASAERAGLELVAAAPFRERGHLLLMEALAASGHVAEAVRVYDDLRRLLREEVGTVPGSDARALYGRLLAEADRPAARAEARRVVSVLVAEAPAPAARHPETVAARLARHHEAACRAIEQHGGAVHRARGAIVVAVFGTPAAHDDDPQRAVGAADDLVGQGWRAGVASGDALVHREAGDELVEGDVITSALRLAQDAHPGATALDDATARRLHRSAAPAGAR